MKSSNFYEGIPIPDYEQIINCMHCGMCLPTCPTYALTGLEKDSPRGRIRLIKAVADGELNITNNFIETMHFCLNCQACVTACPAGVEYGPMVEATHLHIAAHEKAAGNSSRIKEFILNWVFAKLDRLKYLGALLRMYQRSGLEKVIQSTALLNLISKKMHQLSFMAPHVPPAIEYRNKNLQSSSKKDRVGILIGCVQDVFYPHINQDTIDVLTINGYPVYIPKTNYCCGSVHGHNGNLEMARDLARKNINAFFEGKVSWIVMNSAGCGAYMKEYGILLKDDPEYADKARDFSGRVKDITEFLVEQGWRKPERSLNMKVTYHEPCHLVHAQKVSKQPREIISSIPGVEFIELSESTWCCGSAGIYNITRYDDALKVLERKMDNIRSAGVSWVVTGNPGCMLQLNYGIKKFDTGVEIIHPVSLLNKAYQEEVKT